VRWEGGDTEPACEFTFFYVKLNSTHALAIVFCIRESYQVVFVTDRMAYIIRVLRGRWCEVIIRNVQAKTEDKIHVVKDSFYEMLDRVFDKFPKMKS
jgi:hypothetical protein